MRIVLFIALVILGAACSGSRNGSAGDKQWTLEPIVKLDANNPVLLPDPNQEFSCPVSNRLVRWEEKDVFNPAAVVKDNRVWLIYRAEDKIGKFAGTSRIGLANSRDGLKFNKIPTPILYPDNDPMKTFEWEGGCEDPRIVKRSDGVYFMTYTAYDGQTARLCIASSKDLYRWEKHGLVLSAPKYRDLWSKSGAIVCELLDGEIVCKKINGRYWMYWGDTNLYMASSEDMVQWEPLVDKNGAMIPVLQPRPGMFDSQLVEPGPFALWRADGILLLYNSANSPKNGSAQLPPMAYSVGQALFSAQDPRQLRDRADRNFMRPDRDYETKGQVANVCFLEGMVWFEGRWLLYYGTADSKIAVAECRP